MCTVLENIINMRGYILMKNPNVSINQKLQAIEQRYIQQIIRSNSITKEQLMNELVVILNSRLLKLA